MGAGPAGIAASLKAAESGLRYLAIDQEDIGGTVRDIMTSPAETVEEGTSVVDVAQKLIAGHRRRFPVVKNGKFAGQVSCRSILQAVVEFAETPRPSDG